MPKWTDFQDRFEARNFFHAVAADVRSGKLDLGRRFYAFSLAYGVLEAIHCGYDRLAAVEFGVAGGGGLLDLCKAARFFRDELGIDITVFGLDNATGLPGPVDFRDHPELWHAGQYKMGDPAVLRAKLPDFAELIIGDIKDGMSDLRTKIGDSRVAFVSIDVDFYSSTVDCLKLFTLDRDLYLPAVPVYFDDMVDFLTYNSWCGEEAAVREFNEAHELRKIQKNDFVGIKHFHCCHVLDHPIRTGERQLRPDFPLIISRF